MQEKDQKEISSTEKTFNLGDFSENVALGTVVSLTTSTLFIPVEKPLTLASKLAAETKLQSGMETLKQLAKGDFAKVWNGSLYVNAYRETWKHPLKGYSIAVISSCAKNVVFFPAKYGSEKALLDLTGNEKLASMYCGLVAGLVSVYATAPLTVLRTRMVANVDIKSLTLRRLGSGINAIALRDGLHAFAYFYCKDKLAATYGDNCMIAGLAGLIGYTLSSPLNVIAIAQRTAPNSVNMLEVTKKISKNNGAKGFYPLAGLSAFGMFAYGMAFDQGIKLYDRLTAENEDTLDEKRTALSFE